MEFTTEKEKKFCPFCDGDKRLLEYKFLYKTKDFIVKTALGSLVEGYLLLIPTEHINSFALLDDKGILQTRKNLDKLIEITTKIFGTKPFIFEHGTGDGKSKLASSVTHAHLHIIPHIFNDEKSLLNQLEMEKIENFSDIKKLRNQDYLYFENQNNEMYIKNIHDRGDLRQFFRKAVAKEIGQEEFWQWRDYPFFENMKSTIEKLKDVKLLID